MVLVRMKDVGTTIWTDRLGMVYMGCNELYIDGYNDGVETIQKTVPLLRLHLLLLLMMILSLSIDRYGLYIVPDRVRHDNNCPLLLFFVTPL